MLPNGGNRPPLSMQDINGSSGFSGRGNNLNAYRGTLFYRPDNSTGYFSSGVINISDFYSTQATSPVVPGSIDYTSGSSITLPPMFNKLYVTCYGASGGGGGGGIIKDSSYYAGGTNGSAGGTTSMTVNGVTVSANGGGGGGGGGINWENATGSAGANGTIQSGLDGTGIRAGGGGGAVSAYSGYYTVTLPNPFGGAPLTFYYYAWAGGPGGSGGKSRALVLDIDAIGYNAIKAFYGATVGMTLGAGGGGGTGASFYSGSTLRKSDNGGVGTTGYINISWT